MVSTAPLEQNYANHVRRLSARYLAGCIALALALVGAVAELVLRPGIAAATLLALVAGAAAAIYYARVNALVVQTRLVVLEERLRLERLLPEDLRARLTEMTVDRLVATRFASDAEVAGLVRQVLEENLTERREIKRRVRDWRADWLRV